MKKIVKNGAPDQLINGQLYELKRGKDRLRPEQIEWHNTYQQTHHVYPRVLYFPDPRTPYEALDFENYMQFQDYIANPEKYVQQARYKKDYVAAYNREYSQTDPFLENIAGVSIVNPMVVTPTFQDYHKTVLGHAKCNPIDKGNRVIILLSNIDGEFWFTAWDKIHRTLLIRKVHRGDFLSIKVHVSQHGVYINRDIRSINTIWNKVYDERD